MAKGNKGGENSKKAAGNARKAEAANSKKRAEDAKVAAAEDAEWDQGSKKGNKKKEMDEEKKAEALRKKKEREELLLAEEASMPSKPKNNSKRGAEKIAAKRTSKLDSALASFSSGSTTEINASGIDNVLEALSLASDAPNAKGKIDRHPERRFKAAFALYKEANMDRVKAENKGLNLSQREKILSDEFKKHPDNPFNQETIAFNASQEEVALKKSEIRSKISKKYES